MSIIAVQRRLVEVGRIRMGEKKPISGGKTRPAKLAHWRLTSKDPVRLEAAAAIYGGEVKPWEDQHELYTTSDTLDIAVVPGEAMSQYYELWGRPTPKKPVVCLRRCDGQNELLSDSPCKCVAELAGAPDADRQCKPTTRLLVLLRKVPGIGAWRLDTHGWYAAQELAGTAEMLEMLTASRVPVRARLRLEQRSVQREDGLRRFAVPVIDIDATLDDALDALAGGAPVARPQLDGSRPALAAVPDAPPALEAGSAPAAADDPGEPPADYFDPVPADLTAPPAPSIADQVATAHRQPAPRKNAAQPIPPTGIDPVEGGIAVAELDEHELDEIGEPAEGVTPHASSAGEPSKPPTPREDGDGADPESAPTAPQPPAVGDVPGSAPTVVTQEQAQDIAKMCRHAGVPRAAFLAAWSVAEGIEPMVSSARDVPADALGPLRDRLLDVFHGRTTLWVDPETASVKLVDYFDEETREPITIPTAAYWDARLQHVKGVGPVKLVRMARKIAVTRGLIGVADVDLTIKTTADIPDERNLRTELNDWLLTHVDADAA